LEIDKVQQKLIKDLESLSLADLKKRAIEEKEQEEALKA